MDVDAPNKENGLRYQGPHITVYDAMSRKDGVVKDAITDGIRRAQCGNQLRIQAQVNNENGTVDITIRERASHCGDPYMGESEPSTKEMVSETLNVSKVDAKTFFGEEQILLASKLDKNVRRVIYLNGL